MDRKRIAGLLAVCIAVVGVILIARHFSGEKNPAGNVVTVSQAARAVALMNSTQEECEAAESHFGKNEEWYVPYMNRMYEKGYFTEEEFRASKKEAASPFTYEKLGKLLEGMGVEDKEILAYVNNNKPRIGITNVEWQEIYLRLAALFDPRGEIVKQEISVVATVSNVSSLESWVAATSIGHLKFTGLSVDYYIDKKVEVVVKGDQILCTGQLVSENITYKNALVTSVENGTLSAYLYGVVRNFKIEDQKESQTNVICDISLKKRKVTDYVFKTEVLSGKLLRYSDTSVEIEGQGNFDIADGFAAYKTYGTLENKNLYDLVVGYDVQKFIIEDGKLSAVLIDRDFVAQNIRVIIKTNGFSDIYHDSVLLSSDKEYQLTYGGEVRTLGPGEEITIDQASKYLEAGTLKVTTGVSDGKIAVKSLDRGYGTPSYRGILEITKTENGLMIINELPMEEYLYAVIPSEMPYTYNSEALKAQAVCARSYAYKQMMSNSYAALGAHVDDSTAFQVYNNSSENEATTKAVDETYGQIMTYQDQPISAFFYSTSCGSGADATIWGSGGYDYIKGRIISKNPTQMNLGDEAEFKLFISNNYDSYDSGYPWFRWNVTISLENITRGVNNMLGTLYASGPEKVLTKSGDSFVSKEIQTVGNVISIEPYARADSGVLDTILIHGDAATVLIKTESFIRRIFNPGGAAINKNDGTVADSFTSLPSAYFSLEEIKEGEGITGYKFIGGGYGHGAGMSQNGANTMAAEGMTYSDILNFFYHKIAITNAY